MMSIPICVHLQNEEGEGNGRKVGHVCFIGDTMK